MNNSDEAAPIARPSISTQRESESKRVTPWIAHAAGPGILGVFLMSAMALWRLGHPALWADELATVGAAELSWPDLWDLLRNVDMVIGPYYVLMHVWIGVFGDSAVSLRLPSVLAISAAAGLTADIARRLYGKRAGYAAAFIFVLIPTTSRFAQEARPYGLGTLMVVAAAWFIIQRWHNPRLSSDFAAAAMLGAAGMLQPAFLLALPGLGFMRLRCRRQWGRWIVLLCLAAVPGTVLFWYSYTHSSAVWDWIRVLPWSAVPYRASSVLGSREAGGAILVLAFCSLRTRWAELSLAAVGLAPIGLLLAVGMVKPVYTGRLLVFTVPALAILIAGLISRLPLTAKAVSVCALFVLCLPDQVGIRAAAGHGQASRDVASIIGPRYKQGDVAVYGELPRSIAWSPRDVVAYYLPPNRTPRDILALRPPRSGGHFLAQECSNLDRCLGEPPRVWVIRADSPKDPLGGMGAKSTYLHANYRAAATFRRSELTVALLLPRDVRMLRGV